MSTRDLSGDVTFSGSVKSGGGFGKVATEMEKEKEKIERESYWSYHLDVNTGPKDYAWIKVCWSDFLGLFAAVSSTKPVGVNTAIATSPDGKTWTKRNTFTDATYRDICWSPGLGLFCAVRAVSNNNILTSSDGVTWSNTSVDTSPFPGFRSVAWSPELGILCAVGYGTVYTSSNGTSWTSQGVTDYDFEHLCWSPELGLFCGITSTEVLTSPDGSSWTVGYVTATHSIQSVEWSSKLGFFTCGTNGYLISSLDGISWSEQQPAAISGKPLRDICWSPELGMLAVVHSQLASPAIAFSSNGTDWEGLSPNDGGTIHSWYGICWSPDLGRFCAVNAHDYRANVGLSPKADFAAAVARGLS